MKMLAGFVAILSFSLLVHSTSQRALGSDPLVQPGHPPAAIPTSLAKRKACSAYYSGQEDALSQAHNCTEIGASACGGPEQCSCADNERLVSFTCKEGTFSGCSPRKNGSPRCP